MMFDKITQLFRRGFGFRLAVILLLVNSLLIAATLYSVMDSKQGYEDKARVTSQNMVRMLDQSLSASVGKIDLTLLSAVDELEHQLRQSGHLDASQSNAFLLTLQQRLTELSSLRVADASGRVILGTGVSSNAQASWSDRDFFGALRDHPKLGLQVTNPILGRVNNIWIISLVRRYNQPDGRFAGVVSALGWP